ncbi:hypothetical protein BOTBODRAFT_135721 [Botryobasidium botryosum FD-172 SS1]|uniref:CSC1/OSCA1-like 7TM region domain-containing protein n=1 Tax=Botryobasidium botryosum (strain FD-172 SS1) TaxID=930990 RepID=A0A067M6M4_BOTB1|nr:hypothetical protein BOTBODRAFT_135721 [Botryobasidium botryosum FD-172 SS1]
MADLQSRNFNVEYKGLQNQSLVSITIITLSLIGFETLRRKRRRAGARTCPGREDVASVESWEFGYLYQARLWAKNPSPPLPSALFGWVKQAIQFDEAEYVKLNGMDVAVYTRFIRACVWFLLLHTLTTLPILLPIHLVFSPSDVPSTSMARASLSSLVDPSNGGRGLKLLYVHVIILSWVSVTWAFALVWLVRGVFRYRSMQIQEIVDSKPSELPTIPSDAPLSDLMRHSLVTDESCRGLRYRTVMVTNIPTELRNEKQLREYFEYYMSRTVMRAPSLVPGFASGPLSFLMNGVYRAQRRVKKGMVEETEATEEAKMAAIEKKKPVVDRVIVVRKMTDLASLLDRREDVLSRLEAAHISLAQKTLVAVKNHLDKDRQDAARPTVSRLAALRKVFMHTDLEKGEKGKGKTLESEARMELLARALGPFAEELGSSMYMQTRSVLVRVKDCLRTGRDFVLRRRRLGSAKNDDVHVMIPPSISHPVSTEPLPTVWDALHALPRDYLDPYQPLIHLSYLFRGATVPSIDYYTAKLGLLTALINEQRARAPDDFLPVSTAFVTFRYPEDARRACRDLAAHPKNLMACAVVPAPSYEDLDWSRLMRSTFTGEFLKDWVVNLGVWAFTIFWVFPVSSFVTLVSITKLSTVIPALQKYLEKHQVQEQVLSSLVPTLLVSLLAILMPLFLILIAKKAQHIVTISKLHDCILTRYYKFLMCNILVFFCVGTAALGAFLQKFSQTVNPDTTLNLIAQSFPTAAPFYVGWLIFEISMHSGLQIVLFGVPLFVYPATVRGAKTPRKRAAGTRARTFDYFYWLPNHLVVLIIAIVFTILNPLVIPFALIYFSAALVVFKNQFIHVYRKLFESHGVYLVIRIIRYSCDGLILAQVVLLALLLVLKKKALAGITAGVLIVFTAAFKLIFTKFCRAQFDEMNIAEANILCDKQPPQSLEASREELGAVASESSESKLAHHDSVRFWTSKFTSPWHKYQFTSSNFKARPSPRPPISFVPTLTKSGTQSRYSMEDKERDLASPSATSECLISPSAPPAPSAAPAPSTPPLRVDTQPTEIPAGLVSSHPPRAPWDDSPLVDKPYDNPFYKKAIDNVLWLPRKPWDILDLDDTVDMNKSLTSEPGTGQLGQWVEGTEESQIRSITSDQPESPVVERAEHSPMMQRPGFPRRGLSGLEAIVLPAIIAARVDDIEEESDVEDTGRTRSAPSIFGRRSTISSTRPSLPPRSQTHALGVHPSSSFLYRHRSLSRSRARAGSLGQMHLSPASMLSVLPAAAASEVSVAGPPPSLQEDGKGGVTRSVTTRQAVVGEVLAEEQVATADRMRRERDYEPKTSSGSRSWLTAWLYQRKRRRGDQTPEEYIQ